MPPVTFDDPPTKPQRPVADDGFIPAEKKVDPQVAKVAQKNPPADTDGFIASETANAPVIPDPPPPESTLSTIWHWVNNPTISSKTAQRVAAVALPTSMGQFPSMIEKEKKESQSQIAAGHPLRAALLQWQAGTAESQAELLRGMSSPASLALAALTFGESMWGDELWAAGKAGKAAVTGAKVIQTGAGVGYGGLGAVTALTPRQEGESQADYVERVLSASGQTALSVSGEAAKYKDGVRLFVRNRLHLSDDVAEIVSNQIQKINEARAKQVTETAKVKEETSQVRREIANKKAQAVNTVESRLEDNMRSLESQTNARMVNIKDHVQNEIASIKEDVGELDQRKVEVGTQVVVDASHALYEENLRVKKPFEEIGDTFTAPVGKASAIKSIFLNSLTEAGAKVSELPPGSLKALGPIAQAESYIDSGGGIKALEVEGEQDVKFNDLSRIKDDAYSAAYASKDPQVRNGMFAAAQKIDAMQESAVANKDMAKYPRKPTENMEQYQNRLIREHPQSTTAKYAKAKAEYTKFKRGIGSDVVNNWLSAYDVEEQEMGAKISKLVTKEDQFGLDKSPSQTIAIRNALKSVGVDTSAFDHTIEEMRTERAKAARAQKAAIVDQRSAKTAATETGQRERGVAAREIGEARRTAAAETREASADERARLGAIDAETAATIKEAEAKGSVVKGKTASELAGLSNDDILRQQLNRMSQDARAGGVRNPSRLILMVYGMIELARGIKSGAFALGYGAAGEGLPGLLRNPDFQDWVIRKSGIEPSNKRATIGMRNYLSQDLYATLRRIVAGQAAAAGVNSSRAPEEQGQPAEVISGSDQPQPPQR